MIALLHIKHIKSLNNINNLKSYNSRVKSEYIKTLSLASLAIFTPTLVKAEESNTLREYIAKGASYLPGMGETDIYYPNSFLGTWRTEMEITDIIDAMPQRSSKIPYANAYFNKLAQKTPIVYDTTFKNYNNKVIIDRRATGKSFIAGLTGADIMSCESSWEASNPNVLTSSTTTNNNSNSGGSILETKVTKRSVENLEAGQIGYSEYSRLALVNTATDVTDVTDVSAISVKIGNNGPVPGPGKVNENIPGIKSMTSGVPVTAAQRVLVRLKSDADPNKIIGVERLYFYNGDEIEGFGTPKPVMTVKAKLLFVRKE